MHRMYFLKRIFKKKILSVCMCVTCLQYLQKPERASDHLKLEFPEFCAFLRVLGTVLQEQQVLLTSEPPPQPQHRTCFDRMVHLLPLQLLLSSRPQALFSNLLFIMPSLYLTECEL